jgi:hypothetical protein
VYDSGFWFLVNGSKLQKPAWVLRPVLGVSKVDSLICAVLSVAMRMRL